MLKADLHTHSGEDVQIRNYHTARQLISYAAMLGFKVLSITNHDQVLFNSTLKSFAKRRGVLLIPGVEATIQGKHVLIYNIDNRRLKSLKTFKDLEKLCREDVVISAPHPWHPTKHSLKSLLLEHIYLFDAIEYNQLYFKALPNPNAKAVKVARLYVKALHGNSDAHILEQLGYTYTMIDADQNKHEVLEAMRVKGKTIVVTRPFPYAKLLSTLALYRRPRYKKIVKKIAITASRLKQKNAKTAFRMIV
ncbi:PHP domain-containing protein [Candidatus Woesearchaeota archaeon]|nr:PHP domain-containing protein [Candidatus Woesearchaeota archaeon]